MSRFLLLLPLACVLAACGDSQKHASSGGGVAATCIATVVRDGVTYYGEHVEVPAKTDGSAGTGIVPPCFDTMPATKGAAEQVDLLRVQGVDPKVEVVVASQPGVVYRVRR